ncbi:hypothetical protein SAMN05216365_13819 [Porphyromonadaceae bacterium NLAE-zl-C104]|nr:hypothetical protein SAMN05216331_101116 [Porphyromonadaceae bacterium KH3R12]SFS98424.1 hypothetical protein SAMN05216365_13819 [Porphyromonadaceae bacterium NLAE-zl-C104]
MKKFTFSLFACMAIFMMAVSFTACGDDVPEPDQGEQINEGDYHFDLFVTVDKHGGMSSNNKTIVNSYNTLTADKGVLTIQRQGAELGDYSMESISKGKYYYQIPYSGDRFIKYQIKNNVVSIVKERPFAKNVYKIRSYTHAWLDDKTLVIMSSTGDTKNIIWTKLNTDDMTILDEGQLGIEVPEGWDILTTSGILTYRKADNKLFYFYYAKKGSGRTASKEDRFRTAVINPSTMEVVSESVAPVDSEMAGSAYGELMQSSVMYDEAGNLYLACFNKEEDGIEKGMLLRIKAGETTFDPSYNGYTDSNGKLMTIQYIGNNKALVYARDDAAGTAIDSYSHYYAFIDISTGSKTRLSYDGKEIAYSGGRFSQRSVIFNNKIYIGVNTEADTNAIIYIYDIKTGTIEKGAEVDGGFFFDMIRVMEND